MSEHEPLPAVTEAQLAAQSAALDAQLDALCSGITRLRASHDALLAAANVVLSCTAMRTLDWGDPVLETLRAAISKAEEAAHDPRCRGRGPSAYILYGPQLARIRTRRSSCSRSSTAPPMKIASPIGPA
jgi:hypothetical protein